MEQLKMKSLFEGQVQFVPVKLRREWMGNAKGAEMTISLRQAEILVSRGTAKILVKLVKGQGQFVPIKLKREWMGNAKGAKMTITRSQAQALEQRGTAEILVEFDDGDKVDRRKKRDKSMDSPPRDKQVKGAEKTK